MSDAGPQTPELDAAPALAPPGGRRVGVVAAALAAALASAGLAWWLSGSEQTSVAAPTAQSPQVVQPKVQLARAAADDAQVQRAYEQVQTVYAETGSDGVLRFARACEDALARDGRVLDFCLAFDMFAAALAPQGADGREWVQGGEARRLRLAQAALPAGLDPEARITKIDQLMRQASGAAEVQPVREARAAEAPAKLQPAGAEKVRRARKLAAAKRKIELAVAKAPHVPRSRERAARVDPCRLESTPAERLLCASPELRSADQRLKRAYVAALASGADADQLDREQADWRRARNAADSPDELSALYARRIEDLEREADPFQ